MPARPIGEKKRTPQAADPTAPPTRRLEQRCAAAAELLLLPAGLCAAAWWHPLVAQACVLATVKALRLDAKLARTAAADR